MCLSLGWNWLFGAKVDQMQDNSNGFRAHLEKLRLCGWLNAINVTGHKWSLLMPRTCGRIFGADWTPVAWAQYPESNYRKDKVLAPGQLSIKHLAPHITLEVKLSQNNLLAASFCRSTGSFIWLLWALQRTLIYSTCRLVFSKSLRHTQLSLTL